MIYLIIYLILQVLFVCYVDEIEVFLEKYNNKFVDFVMVILYFPIIILGLLLGVISYLLE